MYKGIIVYSTYVYLYIIIRTVLKNIPCSHADGTLIRANKWPTYWIINLLITFIYYIHRTITGNQYFFFIYLLYVL